MQQPIGKEDRSLPGLLADLTQESSSLVRKEVELARVEIAEKISQLGNGVAALAMGGAIAFAGFLVLLIAAVVALDEVLQATWNAPQWLSPLIVGVVVLAGGGLLLMRGRGSVKPGNLAPTRTLQSLRRDRNLAREQIR